MIKIMVSPLVEMLRNVIDLAEVKINVHYFINIADALPLRIKYIIEFFCLAEES